MTALVALTALAAPTAACGEEAAPEAAPERSVLLLSGRDDHGLLAEPTVALVPEPDGGPATGQVPDGTLVAVTETRGEWARVRTLEGGAAQGWVNDFYLRGTAHLACTNEPVELLAVDGERVQVRPTAGGSPRWVPRDTVGELPTRHECRGPGDPGAPEDPQHPENPGDPGHSHDHEH